MFYKFYNLFIKIRLDVVYFFENFVTFKKLHMQYLSVSYILT